MVSAEEMPMSPCGPRISVVIPFFNRGEFIEETVQSVLAQEGPFELVEVLIVDDKSDEPESLHALERLARRPAVAVVRNHGRRGPGAARNVGVRAAKGEWIAFLDSDDVWLPHALATLAQVVNTDPDCQWAGADFCVWYDDGHRNTNGFLSTHPYLESLLETVHPGGDVRLACPVRHFNPRNLTATGCTLIKKSLIAQIGGFCEALNQAEDTHLWIRLALHADFWFIPTVITLVRRHSGNITKARVECISSSIRAVRMLRADPAFRTFRGTLSRRMVVHYLDLGWHLRNSRKFAGAFRAFARAAFAAPFDLQAWRGMAGSLLRRQ